MKMKNMFRMMWISFLTNIPVQETIDYIIHQIYIEKKLPQICSKTIFRRLLLKVTTECLFQLKQKLYKQKRVVPWEVHYQQHWQIFIWFKQKMTQLNHWNHFSTNDMLMTYTVAIKRIALISCVMNWMITTQI